MVGGTRNHKRGSKLRKEISLHPKSELSGGKRTWSKVTLPMRCHASFLLLWFLQALRFIGPFRVIRNQWSQWSPCFTVIRHDTAVSVCLSVMLPPQGTDPSEWVPTIAYSLLLGGRVSTGAWYVDQNMRLPSRNVRVAWTNLGPKCAAFPRSRQVASSVRARNHTDLGHRWNFR